MAGKNTIDWIIKQNRKPRLQELDNQQSESLSSDGDGDHFYGSKVIASYPTSLTAKLIRKHSVLLMWLPETNIPFSYRVCYWENGHSLQKKFLNIMETSCQLNQLKPGTQYQIKLDIVFKTNIKIAEVGKITLTTKPIPLTREEIEQRKQFVAKLEELEVLLREYFCMKEKLKNTKNELIGLIAIAKHYEELNIEPLGRNHEEKINQKQNNIENEKEGMENLETLITETIRAVCILRSQIIYKILDHNLPSTATELISSLIQQVQNKGGEEWKIKKLQRFWEKAKGLQIKVNRNRFLD